MVHRIYIEDKSVSSDQKRYSTSEMCEEKLFTRE